MLKPLLIIALFAGFVNSYQEEGIDFNPRLLQKEVSSIYRNKDFTISDLTVESHEIGSQTNGKFFIVRSKCEENIIVYVGRINSCRSGGCSNQSDPAFDPRYEYFDYFIIFDSLKRVKLVRVFNYEATHGQEIVVRKWLDQFSGYDGKTQLRVGKEVDSISGATISVSGIVADVREKTLLLNNYF